ncbi:SDR family oxidoreductase [Jatrophihabitans cynanchi]|jgi:NAD(P)-dependent dehydrogenase (short-subunit alcohol dehydrogenase family)|uniref:SDR family oxidoreductase n=1 Tax=Jatrophihabitans cynanchi TaxID=2944128 RepID=A0ABY7JWA4_9ACTN|nr:SDR family oxidoreductase [Jatrophihabitans sp. SB3-54]WAX56270.1 SDR family oxidoreductase [Jatrophihabitans sp. SB3-54]
MAGFIEGKVVAVTGGGRGIGRAIALACAEHGARVVVNDLGVALDGSDPTSSVAQSVVDEISAGGGSAVASGDDVTAMDGGENIVRAALDTYGRLDGVVCVAGILRERMLFNLTEDDWDSVVATHLKGTFTLFRAASAVMRKQGSGRLIGFASGAFTGSVAQANYSAAKGGIISLVRSAALGLHRYGITANAIAPVARTRMSELVPFAIEDMGGPEDVAPMAVYLLSDAAAEVTGQVYTVAGSKVAVWAQPRELRTMYGAGRWTPQELAERLPAAVGQDRMPSLDLIAQRAAAAQTGARPNA